VNGTIDWISLAYLIAFIGGFGAFLIAAVALVRRSERRLGTGRPTPHPPAQPGTDGQEQISAYLDRMSAELALPAADEAEVRAELADHIHDSIASLEAEGFEPERAIREALGRLGPPAELGRQLRVAHQSTRRLLAGAGGGVFAAGGGFVLGYLGGLALALPAFPAVFVMGAFLAQVGVPVPDITSHDGGNTINSLLYVAALAMAVATATRYAVRTSAGLSRRAPRTVAVFWAVAGAIVFGWLAIFGMRGPQSWPSVALELCIPLVAVASAFVRIDRPMPHVGRWAVIVTAISLTFLFLGTVAISGSSSSVSAAPDLAVCPVSDQSTSCQPDLGLDTVAPMAPAAWLPAGTFTGGGWRSDPASGGLRVDDTIDGQILPNWTDLRYEAWHSLPMDEPGLIDARYSTPFAVQPAVLNGNSLSAVFHFERLRDATWWEVFLTGVGPDGHRYRIGGGGGGDSFFNGSAWDWLTAPQ
jgi:hypothetical protein